MRFLGSLLTEHLWQDISQIAGFYKGITEFAENEG